MKHKEEKEMEKKMISEELLTKISGGVLDDNVKEELKKSIDFYKMTGMDVDFFINQIIHGYDDEEEVEAFIRKYWTTGKE